MSRRLHLLALVVLLAACDRPGDPAKARAFAAHALRGALAYPNSTVMSVSAGDEAAELALWCPDSVALVADWFRRALPLNGWRLKRDVRDQSGAITIYAENGQRPLWVTLRPSSGAPGTNYTLVGAVVDEATPDTTKRR